MQIFRQYSFISSMELRKLWEKALVQWQKEQVHWMQHPQFYPTSVNKFLLQAPISKVTVINLEQNLDQFLDLLLLFYLANPYQGMVSPVRGGI